MAIRKSIAARMTVRRVVLADKATASFERGVTTRETGEHYAPHRHPRCNALPDRHRPAIPDQGRALRPDDRGGAVPRVLRRADRHVPARLREASGSPGRPSRRVAAQPRATPSFAAMSANCASTHLAMLLPSTTARSIPARAVVEGN